MLDRAVDPMLLRGRRPPQVAGVVTTIALVGVCTGLVYPLERVTTVSSLALGPVRADFAQVERALANLLNNATRYANGSPVVVRARAVGERASIRVTDRGPGIAPAEQERIFEPFYRAPGADDTHAGSGLGLAIAKGFIETNGGGIHVESIQGQGTSFVVDLPTVAAKRPAVAPAVRR
jgi:two-component system sensor histidine kinase KdpD